MMSEDRCTPLFPQGGHQEMLPGNLKAILRDLEGDIDVAARLKCTFGLPAADLPRAQRLELSKSVITIASTRRTKAAQDAFLEAITCLRGLAPFLKTKVQSAVHTVAAVEKYSVNHASFLCFDDQGDTATTLESAKALTSDSLKIVLEARARFTKRPRRVRPSRAKVIETPPCTNPCTKENVDPRYTDSDAVLDDTLETLLFEGGAKHDIDFLLPRNDSASVTVVICGALVVNFAVSLGKVSVRQLLAFAKQIIIPWIEFLQTFESESELQYSQNHVVYFRRIQQCLLKVCRLGHSDPSIVLRARAFAISLGDVKLSQYARDLLKSALCLTRGKFNKSREWKPFDVVGSVYDDALRFVSNFEMSDRRWFTEDVSVWLDHVAIVWSRRSLTKSVPRVFAKRVSALRKGHDSIGILQSCELQLKLFKANAYDDASFSPARSSDSYFDDRVCTILEEELQKVKVPTLRDLANKAFYEDDRLDSQRKAEYNGMSRLRFLRVLEPIRKQVVLTSPGAISLPLGVQMLLEFYIAALVEGLYRLVDTHNVEAGMNCDSEVLGRLDNMTGAAIEAAKEVTRWQFQVQNEGEIHVVARCVQRLLNMHAIRKVSSAQTLWNWLSRFVYGVLQSSFTKAESIPFSENREDLIFISTVAGRWFGESAPICMAEPSCKPGPVDFLEITRACHVSRKDWLDCARCSLQVLSHLLRSKVDKGGCNRERLFRASSSFVRDLTLIADCNDMSQFCQIKAVSPNFLLATVVEYFRYVRRECPWTLRDRKKPHDPLVGLQRISMAILQHLSKNFQMCPLRQLHYVWISFCVDRTALPDSPAITDLRRLVRTSSRYRSCKGHPTVYDFASNKCGETCTPTYASLGSNLGKAMISISEKNLTAVKPILNEVKALLALLESSQDLELMHVCSDITQWIGSLLSTEDYDSGASLAFSIANNCRTQMGITRKLSMSVLKSCRHLGSIGYRAEESLCESSFKDFGRSQSTKNAAGIPFLEVKQRPKDRLTLVDSAYSEPHISQIAIGSLDAAGSDLKLSLLQLMSLSKATTSILPPSLFSVAGVNVDVSFDYRLESGQARLSVILVFVDRLYRFARLLHAAENLPDGRYYFEKCLHVAMLCLPETNFFRVSILAVNLLPSISPVARDASEEDFLQVLKKLEDTQRQCQDCSNRNLISASITAHTVGMVALELLSDRLTSSLEEESGARLIDLHKCSEALVRETVHTQQAPPSKLTVAEVELCTALTHAYMQNNVSAANILASVSESREDMLRHTKAMALFFLARSQLVKIVRLKHLFDVDTDCTQVPDQNSSQRETRSRARRKGRQVKGHALCSRREMSEAVTEVCELLSYSFPSPQLYRRVWSLRGMLEDCEVAAASHLSHCVGHTFDIRWGAVMERKALRNCASLEANRQRTVEDLNETFKSMSITSPQSTFENANLQKLMNRLDRESCVIVGLSVDEFQSSIVAWRLSPNGAISKRLFLPYDGACSIAGVANRISTVIRSVKEHSVAAGQSLTETEKEEWWDHRYSLDTDVKNILSDIETKWLRDFRTLLVPSIFDEQLLDRNSSSGERFSSDVFQKLSRSTFPDLCKDGAIHEENNTISSCQMISDGIKLGQLVLVIDTVLEQIPWESLPILRRLQVSVTRAPSLNFLNYHLEHPVAEANSSDLFFVINPAGDLQRTEDKFKEVVKSQLWNGSFGKITRDEIATAYKNECIYLYCGHGAGDQFLSPHKFAKSGEAPIALLMGCSSARPDNMKIANCESNGPAIDFLVHGSRAVVGNLWDVSDKDIDRFTSSVLSHWLGVQRGESTSPGKLANLAEAVSLSRTACRLPFLVGAAAVVLGAPNITAQRINTERE